MFALNCKCQIISKKWINGKLQNLESFYYILLLFCCISFFHLFIWNIFLHSIVQFEYCVIHRIIKINKYAKDLLFYFVQYYPVLYGKENMIYTVHSLIHLSDDAKRFGPLVLVRSFRKLLAHFKKIIKKTWKTFATNSSKNNGKKCSK